MEILDRIDKQLMEQILYTGEVSDHVQGIKRWLDDFESAYAYGSKDTKAIINNIVKAVNKLRKAVK